MLYSTQPRPSRRPSTSSRAESISGAHGTPVYDPIRDFAIRKKVLVKTPELAALHRELVVSGQITETEFWDGRELRARLTDVRLCVFVRHQDRVLASPARACRSRLAEEG